MRIVSLLPALTELVAYLGHERDLVGISHECDWPETLTDLPRLTRGRINTDAPGAAINAQVAENPDGLFELEAGRLQALRPDLILTQAQCDVCAVSERSVRAAARELGTRVLSVNPTNLAGVIVMFEAVARELGSSEAGLRVRRWRQEWENTLGSGISRAATQTARPGVLLLEWLDPPFTSGHWNPEIIEQAGGIEVLGRPGSRSRVCDWAEIGAAAPEVVIAAPCGMTLERAEKEIASVDARPEWRSLPAVQNRRVVLVDGNAYFARPGPRLLDSLRIAMAAIGPQTEERLFAAAIRVQEQPCIVSSRGLE